jgi:transcription elongation factor GreA
MEDNTAYLTRDGLEKLQIELDQLVRFRRKEIASRIQEAKELGDLSENAEYQEAKNEQAFNEGRIEDLENTIKHAQIIEDSKKLSGIVQVGSTVKISLDGASTTYTIVGSNEADPLNGKVSNESPIGRALLGKKLNDVATVTTPKGEVQYAITEVA